MIQNALDAQRVTPKQYRCFLQVPKPNYSATNRIDLECEDIHPWYFLFHYLDSYIEEGDK
jgi:hypothetical protein